MLYAILFMFPFSMSWCSFGLLKNVSANCFCATSPQAMDLHRQLCVMLYSILSFIVKQNADNRNGPWPFFLQNDELMQL